MCERFWTLPVAHNALAARVGLEIAMPVQKIRDLRLDRLRQQGAGPAAQNLGVIRRAILTP